MAYDFDYDENDSIHFEEINISALPIPYKEALKEVADQWCISCTMSSGLKVVLDRPTKGANGLRKLKVRKVKNTLHISAHDIPAFLRGFLSYIYDDEVLGDSDEREWPVYFNKTGLMLDCSRNAVPNISTLKFFILRTACMGLNTFYLYMEDTYKLPGEPYFGYMRGAYTQEELKDLDAYAQLFGVELVPCIQTLAHLNQFLEWADIRQKYADIDDILNVGTHDVVALQDRMIKHISETFSTRRIHIGLDEAYKLGRGRYADMHGLRNAKDIMLDHLELMRALCKKYGMNPMVWDDMFFRNYSTDEHNNMDVAIPDDVQLVYWNYYDNEADTYSKELQKRKALAKQVVFAGGAWKWMGFTPHHSKTRMTLEASITACKQEGIQEYMLTSWADDGAESPLYNALFGCVILAAQCYGITNYFDDFRNFLGIDQSDFLRIEELNLIIPEDEQAVYFDDDEYEATPYAGETPTPSKYLLYEDPVFSKFIYHTSKIKLDLHDYYRNLSEFYQELSEDHTDEIWLHTFFLFYSSYAKVLQYKADLALKLRKAVQEKSIKGFEEILSRIEPCIENIGIMQKMRSALWFIENKPQGLEVIHTRLGGIMGRFFELEENIRVCIETIEEFDDPKLEMFFPLEDELLPICEADKDKEIVSYNRALRGSTPQRHDW